MLTVKTFIIKLFYPVALIYWKYWSGLYQFLYHRKYKDIELSQDLNLVQAQEKMDMITWTKDTSKELWDSCGSPHWVQHAIDEIAVGAPQPKGSLDCDDFSIWALNAINKNFFPRIFTFTWLDYKGKLHGHAMCLTRNKDGSLVHIGNWGVSRPYRNLREACIDILKMYHSDKPIGWALLNKNLSITRWGRDLPEGNIR
jgi:hypothetical protein